MATKALLYSLKAYYLDNTLLKTKVAELNIISISDSFSYVNIGENTSSQLLTGTLNPVNLSENGILAADFDGRSYDANFSDSLFNDIHAVRWCDNNGAENNTTFLRIVDEYEYDANANGDIIPTRFSALYIPIGGDFLPDMKTGQEFSDFIVNTVSSRYQKAWDKNLQAENQIPFANLPLTQDPENVAYDEVTDEFKRIELIEAYQVVMSATTDNNIIPKLEMIVNQNGFDHAELLAGSANTVLKDTIYNAKLAGEDITNRSVFDFLQFTNPDNTTTNIMMLKVYSEPLNSENSTELETYYFALDGSKLNSEAFLAAMTSGDTEDISPIPENTSLEKGAIAEFTSFDATLSVKHGIYTTIMNIFSETADTPKDNKKQINGDDVTYIGDILLGAGVLLGGALLLFYLF